MPGGRRQQAWERFLTYPNPNGRDVVFPSFSVDREDPCALYEGHDIRRRLPASFGLVAHHTENPPMDLNLDRDLHNECKSLRLKVLRR
jgi:hypothetical protein